MERLASLRRALIATSAIATAACVPQGEPRPLEPMGRLPNLVTTAEPEWIPFALLAGEPLAADPREARLAEPRRIDVGGDAERALFVDRGRALLVQARRGACEEVLRVELGRTGAVTPVSAPGTRARLGAAIGDAVVIAEAPCAEPAERGPWSLVRVEASGRTIVGRPEAEVVGLASDGAALFVALRAADGRGRVERLAATGGGARTLLTGTTGVVASARDVASLLAVRPSAAGAQIVAASDAGGDLRALSKGHAVDLDPTSAPGGAAFLFASTRASADPKGGAQVYLGRTSRPEGEGGDAAERVTFAGEDNRAPALAPSGRTLAWVSDRAAPGGPRSVVVARFDGEP